MPKRQPESLPKGQIEVLRFIVENQPVTVAQVADHFARAGGKARTTVLTVMERLRSKGYLKRRKRAGLYHYMSSRSKQEFLTDVIDQFIENALGGSVSPFVAYLAKNRDLSSEELVLLEELVKQQQASDNGGDT